MLRTELDVRDDEQKRKKRGSEEVPGEIKKQIMNNSGSSVDFNNLCVVC